MLNSIFVQIPDMIYRILICLSITLLLFSCASREEVIYMNDIDTTDGVFNSIENYETKVKPGDVLRITVSSTNMESVKDFNIKSSGGSSGGNQSPLLQGYLVNQEGFIKFPLVGTVKVDGYSRREVEEIMVKEIQDYSTNAFVEVNIINFKITVLGAVGTPGTFTVNEERVSILQAIGLAGDVLLGGKREKVLLVRNEDGVQKSHRIDLTSADLLNSPYFYMQQNDLLYVEENQNQIIAATIPTTVGFFISLFSFATSLVFLFIK